MKKLLKITAVLAALLVIAVVVLAYSIDRLARHGIEEGATYALGVPTTLDQANIGILAGSFTMDRLNIANPQGFQTPHILHLNHGGVSLSLASLREEVITLPTLTLSGLDMNLERRNGSANYTTILDNLKKLESSDQSSVPAEKSEEGRKFQIDEVLIRNVQVHFDLLPEGGDLTRIDLPIDEIRLTKVGSNSNKGVLITELTGILLKAVISAAIQKGGDLIPSALLGDLTGQLAQLESLGDLGIGLLAGTEGNLQNLSTGFTDLADNLGKGLGDAATDLQDIGGKVDDAISGLGGLLGGNKKK